ncbi:MAG TPA: hypothetical protein EYQ61_02345 [Dehalococcoidia bacterium]|jgi:L-alanine-DL-glutamate epimerase-like enolase superfamily enzyme|nr:hypothetical protein [Dehalococcoidia bacterium]HIK89995.1 hypothetical protein [Dehalococcoidia bacterium]
MSGIDSALWDIRGKALDAPWRDDIMTHPFEIENGNLLVHNRPGLGSDLIESELEKHPWTGGNNW